METIQSPFIHPADVCPGVMARLFFFIFMFWDLIPRTVDGWAPLPFLRCCGWWCCCCYWWCWLGWRWLQRQRRGDGSLFFLVLKPTWEVEAWVYEVVWLVVVGWFVVLVMKGWNEGFLVVETISAPGPASFWTPVTFRTSPGLGWSIWPWEECVV